ncbi:MAG: hypothetical protein E6J78_03495 [Deltaproteobacteria bacterium]|nr:MAG: hypothetical protein E6J78_03495 [Deltaproteobacteria bacterium]
MPVIAPVGCSSQNSNSYGALPHTR